MSKALSISDWCSLGVDLVLHSHCIYRSFLGLTPNLACWFDWLLVAQLSACAQSGLTRQIRHRPNEITTRHHRHSWTRSARASIVRQSSDHSINRWQQLGCWWCALDESSKPADRSPGQSAFDLLLAVMVRFARVSSAMFNMCSSSSAYMQAAGLLLLELASPELH